MNDHQQAPQTSITRSDSTALAHPQNAQGWADPDWQRLWLTLDRMPWRTLALMPASDGAPENFTLRLAITLSRTGMSHVGAPIMVADGTQVPLNQLNDFLADVRACRAGGERVIIALSGASQNPTTISIAKDTDGVVLCVLMDRMRMSEAKRTIGLIGASKFLGSVIIQSEGISIPPPPPK